MEIIQALVLGIVQGFSEWLPISSSAHLAIADRILQAGAGSFFFAALHLGSLIALCAYFRKEIAGIITGKHNKQAAKWGIYAVYVSVPLFVAGLFFHNYISMAFSSFPWIGYALIANGLMLFITRYFDGKGEITAGRSWIIGLCQAFSIIPGISRLGVTASAGIFSGMKRENAVMFSLLLAFPALLGAFAYEVFTSAANFGLPVFVGIIAAALTGFFSIKLLLNIIKNGEFHAYWLYCIIVGLMMLYN